MTDRGPEPRYGTNGRPPPARDGLLERALQREIELRRALQQGIDAERRARTEVERRLAAESTERRRWERAAAEIRARFDLAIPEREREAEHRAELGALRAENRLLLGELQAQIEYAAEAVLAMAHVTRPKPGPPPARWTSLLRDLLAIGLASPRLGVRNAARTLQLVRVIRSSGEFDEAFYRGARFDLQAPRVDPVRHYVLHGAAEGMDPSPAFSTEGYLEAHRDVAARGANPFGHYLRIGRAEGRYAPPSTRVVELKAPVLGANWVSGEAPPSPPERGGQRGWPLARDPARPPASLRPYDRRPDDPVPVEAARGRAFLQAHGLLGDPPDFAGAVSELNGVARGARIVAARDAARPDVSVVIPVYGQLAYTLNCLHALLRHESRRSLEIIVVDDASPDASPEHLPQVADLIYERQLINGGFIDSCNTGAAMARGEHLVLLNNDTRVVEGWLDELIDSFELFPRAGLVGSKLLYPDASLQEAGGIIWRDGSAWNYGRNMDPNRPEFCYARQVDYVSGASIALPTSLWRDLGGFDERYRPAYSEDSDLAMRIREAGREVWMQPLSRVVHYEGKTSGTDLSQGAKAHQVSNHARFLQRWEPELRSHRENGTQPHLERDRAVTKRALVLDATTPTPDQDAGSVTTVKIITVFQNLGYKVTFAPADNFLFQERYTAELQRRGVECLYAPYVHDLETHLAEFGVLYDVVHVFRYSVMHRVLAAVRKHCPTARVVINNMDLHYLRLERQAAVESSAELLREARTTKSLELRTMAEADVVCVPSTEEKRLLEAEGVRKPTVVMPYMVDLHPPQTGPAERGDVIFIGGFRHTPNVDAVLWFVRGVWADLEEALPGEFLIVGAHPPPEVERLGGRRVRVTGRVDDLGPLLERARVLVAPLRFGAGVKGKIYTAMAHGVPVVSTALGVEGMGLEPDREVLIADDAAAFAAGVKRLYADDELWRRLSDAGLAFVREHSTVEAGARAMTEALTRT